VNFDVFILVFYNLIADMSTEMKRFLSERFIDCN